jgi:hypothetical protein
MKVKTIVVGAALLLFSIAVSAEQKDGGQDLRPVKAMLSELHLGEAFVEGGRRGLREAAQKNPAMAMDIESMILQMTETEAVDLMAPIYGRYLTGDQADELRVFLTKAPGSKIWRSLLDEMRTGKAFVAPNLTPDEKQQVELFLGISASWRAWAGSKQAIEAKLYEVGRNWGEELMRRKYAVMFDQLADTLDPGKPGSRTGGRDPVTVRAQDASEDASTTAVQLMQHYRELIEQNDLVTHRLAAKSRELQLGAALAAKNLISREGISDSRRRLDAYELELRKGMRELGNAFDAYADWLHGMRDKSKGNGALGESYESGLTVGYAELLRSEESQRHELAIMRQILALADENFGKIRLEETKLVFSNPDDLRDYLALLADLDATQKSANDAVSERNAMRRRVADKLRGVSAGTGVMAIDAPRKSVAAAFGPQPANAGYGPAYSPGLSVEDCHGPMPAGLKYPDALRTAVERCLFLPPNIGGNPVCEVEFDQSSQGVVADVRVLKCDGAAGELATHMLRAVRKASPLPLPISGAEVPGTVRIVFRPDLKRIRQSHRQDTAESQGEIQPMTGAR